MGTGRGLKMAGGGVKRTEEGATEALSDGAETLRTDSDAADAVDSTNIVGIYDGIVART
jgi:hypothetical protein